MSSYLISAADGIAFIALLFALCAPVFYRKSAITGGSLTLLLCTQLAYFLIAASKLGESSRMWPGNPELASTLYLAGAILFVFFFYAFDRNSLLSSLRESIEGHQSASAVLSSQAQRLSAILDILPDPVLLAGGDDNVIYVNKEFSSRFFPSDDINLASVSDLPTSARSLVARCPIQEIAAFGQPITRILSLPSHGRSGEVYRLSAFPLRNAEGATVMALYHFHDITPEIQMLDESMQWRKSGSLDALVGGVSHEFNNLLTGISCVAQLLSEDHSIGEGARTSIQRIKELVVRGESLVNDLTGAMRQPGSGVVVDVGFLLEKNRSLLEDALPDGIKLRISVISDAVKANVDPNDLLTAVLHLVANAGEASLPGGTVAITISRSETADLNIAQLPQELNVQMMRIAVADSGRGIPAEERERIFDPFFTTRNGHRGMGLPIASSIVSRYGGRLQLEKTDELGTEFAVYLPAANTAQPSA